MASRPLIRAPVLQDEMLMAGSFPGKPCQLLGVPLIN